MEIPPPFEANPEFLKKEVSISPPAVESLLDDSSNPDLWPPEVCSSNEVAAQCQKRRDLIQTLEHVSGRIRHPLQTTETAILEGNISENDAEKLYAQLSEILANPDYQRILLYLPFEYLPQKSWHSSNEFLQQALDKFRTEYMSAWHDLLTSQDVRANFVDGDVIEIEERQEDLPRVVKAAHLIPILVQKGLLQPSYAFQIMEESDDPVLKSSIADTITIMADMEQLTESDIAILEQSSDQRVLDIVAQIKNEQHSENAPESHYLTVQDIKERLNNINDEIEQSLPESASAKRKQWLRESLLEKSIDELAGYIAHHILSESFTPIDASGFWGPDSNNLQQAVLVDGVRRAVENKANEEPDAAKALLGAYFNIFEESTNSHDAMVNGLGQKALRRFYGLGLIDNTQLERLNIPIPKLSGSSSEIIEANGNEFKESGAEIISNIEQSDLAPYIYPVVLTYGSRLKGYGDGESDLDVAVFVRPGTPSNQSQRIQDLVPGAIEFWLEEDRGGLTVIDFPAASDHFGASYWTHLLFSGIWVGNQQSVGELHKKLLSPYINSTEEQIHNHNARDIRLHEMEKDALQYRLMHKGYKRFAPDYGGIDTPHSADIDGQSTFWDSGYRRTALELFAKRVFLPKLSE